LFEKLLPFPEGTTFDIILSWNLLDYLRRREIQALVRHLNRFCRTGTYLLALSSTLRDIPSKPTSFRILDEETLVYLVESAGTRSSPRYTPRDFTSMMTGFRVHNSFLLKHGMQEYLFVHQ